MAANAADYGTSPETAVDMPPFWIMDPSVKEAWFKIKTTTQNGRPAMAGPTVTADEAECKIYICAETLEAPKRNGTSYIIESGKEYLMKIVPKVSNMLSMSYGPELPESMQGNEYYPIEVTTATMGITRTIDPGKTVWYKMTAPYASNITTNLSMMPVMDVEKIVVKHQECPGGVNEGSAVMPAYNKAGVNVVGVTASSSATAPVQFQFGFNAFGTLNCNNNLYRSKPMTLDAEETYPDAYYTVERVFVAPEDGEYTFINHGAKGTELNIGKAVQGDDVGQGNFGGFKLSCDFEGGETAIVGDNDATIVKTLKKGDRVAVQSDAFAALGGKTYLKVVKGNAAGIDNISKDNNEVEIVALGGKSFSVNNVLLSAGARIAVYDMNARKVSETAVAAGSESQIVTLDVPSGIYLVVVYGSNRSASAKIAVE